MDKYNVYFAVTYEVEAEGENEAIEKAATNLIVELQKPSVKKDLLRNGWVNVEKI